MGNKASISVKVCYALPHYQEIISLSMPKHASVLQAIQHSKILDKYPEINLNNNNVGIHGNIVSLEHVLSDNDRVEIYRPLHKNPMEARRMRAELSS